MNIFAKFIAVGILNTALGYAAIFGFMYLLGASPILSNAAGYLIGLSVSYVLNRRFTFKSSAKTSPELLRFLLVFLVSYLANLAVLLILIQNLEVHQGIAQVLAGVVYVATSFLMNKYYVFRHQSTG
jgi:putative flippase GtrA